MKKGRGGKLLFTTNSEITLKKLVQNWITKSSQNVGAVQKPVVEEKNQAFTSLKSTT